MFARHHFFSARPVFRELYRPCIRWKPASQHSLCARAKTYSSSYFPTLGLHLSKSAPKINVLPMSIRLGGIAGVTLLLSAWTKPTVLCESPVSPAYNQPSSPVQGPQSSVNLYKLSFGTVCGLCTGVFIKKGAKAVALALGGVFVLLQYFGSLSIIRVDWSRISSNFKDRFYTRDSSGTQRPPTVSALWTYSVNFLTADFQSRASFLAGLMLGLRVA